MDTKVIEQYIDDLMTKSTAELPVWNIEKARAGIKSGWDYIDGCMILALLELYETSKNEKFLKFADYYEDFRIADDGTITGYNKEAWNIDEINGGKNLITLYKLTKKEKYKKALEKLYDQIENQPRTSEGNFWHKAIYPNQIWLDGLYMGQPFYMEYDSLFNGGKNKDDIYNQFFNVEKIMKDPKTGLYYHGYDSSKSIFWADKKTGLSKNFWLRSLGWFSMAMLDTLNKAPDRGSENWNHLKKMFVDLQTAMLKYQDESGMWFQVPDKPNQKDANGKENYLETSGTAIFAYSLLKGFRTQILEETEFQAAGVKAFRGICNKYLTTDNGKLGLGGICLVAGLGPEKNTRRDGTFEYYLSEPIVQDDAKGVGPFILAYNEFDLIGN
ncbi:glycoside hydrolase family 88/105 protein [Treponema zioleckii]|uniref:glycoside hydrolase family 88/105 protein n=1 Tax=Treponema zioleckii TaxID=331680 RepID=UPI0018D8467A|nr:glycoside hydrolase family 88 protein [Treponema zioleckii]